MVIDNPAGVRAEAHVIAEPRSRNIQATIRVTGVDDDAIQHFTWKLREFLEKNFGPVEHG